MARVEAHVGPHASERVEVIDRLFHDGAPHSLLLTPTSLSAKRRLERLLLTGPHAAFWGSPPVQTFQDFVERLLHGSDSGVVPLSPLAQRLLMEQVIARLHGDGKLGSIGAAAETPGFVSHVQRTIAQLKQAAVEPEAFAKRTAVRDKGSRLDALVAEVYSAYQQALLDQNAYDREGLYWEAALLCDAGRPKGLADVQTLILDGFDEFTAAQFRLLEKLAPHLDQLVFGLEASQDNATAEDTYQIPLATHERICAAFSGISESTPLTENPAKTYSEFAAARVFWRERPTLPQNLAEDVSVQRCVNPLHELEYMGREIKHLLLDGKAHANEIAVVFPDLPAVLDAGTSIFRELGLPVRNMTPRNLFDTSLGGFLLGLFDALATWQRDLVLKLMTSPWMACINQAVEASAAFPLIARASKIIAGRDAWRDGLDELTRRMIASPSSNEIAAFRARIVEPEAAIAAARETLAALARIETMIPQEATAAEFAAVITEVLQSLRIEDAIEQLPMMIRPEETAALEALHRFLDELRRSLEANGGLKTNRNTFANQLRSLLKNVPCQTAQPKDAILWLDLENVRHLTFPFVFFCGANEGVFPRRSPVNAIYSERDIASLARAGIDLRGTTYYLEHEMNLFRHLLATASSRLVITYAIHSNDGKAALPSPFLDDLFDVLPEDRIHIASTDSNPAVAPAARIACARDLRNRALAGDGHVKTLFTTELAGLNARAEIERRRHLPVPFDAYDGLLAQRASLEELAEHFGDEHEFSASQLERYMQCPFLFFAERVLRVVDVEPAEVEFNALLRGQILHYVLQKFHEQHTGLPVAEIPEADAKEAMEGIIQSGFKQFVPHSAASAGIEKLERRRMEQTIERYLRMERDNRVSAQWRPSYFERRFGGNRHRGSTSNDSRAFELKTSAGVARFSGSIDRIDFCDTGARIVDYKSSRIATSTEIGCGADLQVVLYALAYQQLIEEAAAKPCVSAMYVVPGRKKSLDAFSKTTLEKLKTTLQESVAQCLEGIRRGVFHPSTAKDPCSGCSSRRPCRYQQARMARKSGIETP